MPKAVRECRFVANPRDEDLVAFRKDLLGLAGGFTEIGTTQGTRYIVGLSGRGARRRIQRLLAEWGPRFRQGGVGLEDHSTAADRDEIYFLLPLQKNPDPSGRPRLPLFTNEQLAAWREELARRFHFRPEMVQVYGEYRNDAGVPVPDKLLLLRVPRRNRGTVRALRRFIRLKILAAPNCDQDCIYLSSRWRAELVPRT
ncbi:MAG: hypothetical protein HY744_30170 [Deltaproteobacteria bacterium]|nr:hypothetical protein [Deltaproteobacteria bacterium]